MTIGRNAHGTMVAVQLTPGGAFTDIAELGDVKLPGTTRNEFDATVQNRNIDDYIMGVFRRTPLTFPLNFLPANGTHDHLTGLYKLQIDNTFTGWRITVPAISGGDAGVIWIASGHVQNIDPTAPVDGKLAANVTVRLSGLMTIGGVVIGT
jgi:hypothetical protein